MVTLDKVYSSLMAFPIFGGLLEKFGCCGKAHPAKSSHVQLSITSFLHGLKAAQTYVDHMFGQFWDRNPSWLLRFTFSLHPGCSHFFAIFFLPLSPKPLINAPKPSWAFIPSWGGYNGNLNKIPFPRFAKPPPQTRPTTDTEDRRWDMNPSDKGPP